MYIGIYICFAFEIFKKVIVCLALYTEQVKLPTFVDSTNLILRDRIFSFYAIIKMAANYSEIGRLGKLEAAFQQVPLVHFFLSFRNTVMKHQSFKTRKGM